VSRVRENRTHGSTGGGWKRSTLATDTKKNNPTGNCWATNGFVTYLQDTPPRQPSTLHGNLCDTGLDSAKVPVL
jgi:hypothetical protein